MTDCEPVPVRFESLPKWTEAREGDVVRQAEVRAATVVALTAIGVVGLALRVVAVDVHGEVEPRVHRSEATARDFISRGYALHVPVRPVHEILKHSQREWMRQTFANNLPSNIIKINLG